MSYYIILYIYIYIIIYTYVTCVLESPSHWLTYRMVSPYNKHSLVGVHPLVGCPFILLPSICKPWITYRSWSWSNGGINHSHQWSSAVHGSARLLKLPLPAGWCLHATLQALRRPQQVITQKTLAELGRWDVGTSGKPGNAWAKILETTMEHALTFFWHPYFLNVLAFSRDFPCSTSAGLSVGAAMDVGRGRIYPEDTWAAGLLRHRISKGLNMSGVASIPVESLDHKVRTDTVFVKVVCDIFLMCQFWSTRVQERLLSWYSEPNHASRSFGDNFVDETWKGQVKSKDKARGQIPQSKVTQM